jgi:glycosyltransferase involved in cell wall biosynthesis
MTRTAVDVVTVVPSPYQRDLFGALAARPEIDLRVHYLEASSPDSPWPAVPLRAFETVLPGFWTGARGVRWHVNRLPDFARRDVVILSSYASLTGQMLMRRHLRTVPWVFWGEQIRLQPSPLRARVQRMLIAPLQRAAAIVGIGQAATDDYHSRFPESAHYSIPYHCDVKPFLACEQGRDSNRPFTFLFCGQMIARKGVDLLLDAFERLLGTGIDARLVLVGREADLPAFMAAVQPRTREAIEYRGFKAPEDLPQEFSAADAFVLPSRYDGWGVVINQALAAGLPIVSSDAVAAGVELVESGRNGLHCRAGDASSLFECLSQVAADRRRARAWGEQSRDRARALTPAAGAEKWIRVIDEIVGSRRKAA